MKGHESGPLEGIKVLDLTRMLPGPFCTMLLGDWGADVIMIEQPSGPAIGPRRKGFHVNRNKRSLILNLKEPRGLDIFYELVSGADAVVEGFRPGVPARLKIDYSSLEKINPGLVYCSISGYGQDGPYRDRVGHDINYIAIAGLLSLTGEKGRKPVVPGTQVGDIAGGGLMAASSILAALFCRERTGRGQYIEVAMTDGALAFNAITFHDFFTTGTPPVRGGHRLLGALPCYNVYRTRDDRYVTIGALEPKFWAELCLEFGREDLIERQFDGSEATLKEVREIFASKTSAEWDDVLASKEVCYAPVLDLAETSLNEQVLHRQMIVDSENSAGGPNRQVGVLPKFSLSPAGIRTPSPEPGRDTCEILKGLGMDEEEIAGLEKEGVVKGPSL
jgi:alpha-methylacyl-CoA racemase